MLPEFFPKKFTNIILITASILSLAALIMWGISHAVTSSIETAIKKLNDKGPELNIEYRTLDSRWPFRLLQFKDLVINLNDCQPDQHNALTLNSEEFSISGLSLWKFLFKRELIIRKVQADHWELEVVQEPGNNDLYLGCLSQGGNQFPLFKINHLVMNAGDVVFKNRSEGSSQTMAQAELTIEAKDFHKNFQENWNYGYVRTQIHNFQAESSSGLHSFSIANVAMNTEDKRLIIDSLEFKSLGEPDQLVEKTGVESHWYDITIPKIECANLQLDSLLFYQHLTFEKLEIDGGAVQVRYDKRPSKRIEEFKELPHNWLTNTPLCVRFDSIDIKNISIGYEEHVKAWTQPGQLTFTKVQIFIGQFDSRRDDLLAIDASGKLMDRAMLKSQIQIPLIEPLQYRVSGSLEKLKLESINPMLALITNGHIASGISEQLNFHFEHNLNHATGSTDWSYYDLKLALNENKNQGNFLKKTESLFINTFIIKSHNPYGKKLRPGNIEFSRDTTRSVLNFWWKSIASGLESTVL